MTLEITTNLAPRFVKPFLDPDRFARAFQRDRFESDPSPAPEELGLGFAQSGGWTKPARLGPTYRWIFDTHSNTVTVEGDNSSKRFLEDHPLLGRAEIDVDYLRAHPSILAMPTVATLGVWERGIEKGQRIEQNDVKADANRKVLECVLSGGWQHAKNLSLPQDPRLRYFYRPAVMMDTWGRTPGLMSASMINDQIQWHIDHFGDHEILIGTGSENLDDFHVSREKRGRGGLKEDGMLAKYIKARTQQLDKVLKAGHTPILFPDIMHMGLSDGENIWIVGNLLKVMERKIVAHVLGTPFVPDTDWYNLNVVEETVGLAKALKTSTPNHQAQLDYYKKANQKGSLILTGDDRGWGVEWLYGAQKQLEGIDDISVLEEGDRNGFGYIEGPNNIGALLGYFGLNLHQTIAAICELNKWYYNKLGGNHTQADEHLSNYRNLTALAMGMSTDVFFGPMNPTRAYTWYVWLANIFTGVLDPEDGYVLPHKANVWEADGEQQVIGGRLMVWMLLCGAITPGEAEEIVKKHPHFVSAKVST